MWKIVLAVLASVLLLSCSPSRPAATPSGPQVIAEPTPDYIWWVRPEPGGSLTSKEYSTSHTTADSPGSSICVEFILDPFLEIGDFFSSEEWFSRFRVEADDHLDVEPNWILQRYSEGFEVLDPETKEVLYYHPPGDPYILCFPAELEPGTHAATFIGRKTSGQELKYTWPFTITAD